MYIRQHFSTITRHRILVMKHCFRAGMYWQGLTHDLSKYSWTEFSKGCKYWQGNRSPNNAEREDTGVSLSWLHHKGRNRHHFEYWIDYEVDSERMIGGMPMPRKYIAEMVMDRVAACKIYMADTYNDAMPYMYFMKSFDRLWFVHDDVKRDLKFLLGMLRARGEKETFRYIKYVYLKKDRKPNAKVEKQG